MDTFFIFCTVFSTAFETESRKAVCINQTQLQFVRQDMTLLAGVQLLLVDTNLLWDVLMCL